MQMTISDLKILIAGFGSIGKRHTKVLQQLGARHLAVFDPSDEARDAFSLTIPGSQVFDDFQNALSEFRPDAVFILSPTRLHVEMAKQAILADCHVFIEKPLSNSTEGIEELSRLAAQKNSKVMVGFCFRYHTALLEAKTRLESGEIGRLISIRAMMGEPFYEIHPDYLNMYYSKYSGAFELVHDLDLAIWFAGQEIDSVQAVYGSFSDMGMESPDIVEMLVKFSDRCVANVHLDFFQSPRRRQFELIGTRGVITVEFASWDKATLSTYTRKNRAWRSEVFATQRDNMFRDEDSAFLSSVLHNGAIQNGISEAAKSLQAIEAVYKPY